MKKTLLVEDDLALAKSLKEALKISAIFGNKSISRYLSVISYLNIVLFEVFRLSTIK